MLRPPGPKPQFLIGNIPLAGPEPLATYRRWADEYGDIFYYRAAWLHVYFLNRPDLIDYVLVRNPQNFLKDRVIRNSRWMLGSGLLTAEGEAWKRQRRLAQPAFSRDRVASYGQCFAESAAQMLTSWRAEAVVDIHREMMNLTLRVVVRALFEMETTSTDRISRCLNTVMLNSVGGRLLLPAFVRHLPIPGMRDVRHAVDDMNTAVYAILRERRGSGKQSSGDLLSILMRARDEDGSALTDEQLRDELMTFLLAGHETTALALSWAFYLLSQNTDDEAKLHEELDRVLGGRLPDMSSLASLPFLDRVIKETLRLYPPAWSVARTVIDDFELEGYRIPAGSNVVMSQWIMHRDRRYFDQPEKFDPDRWSTAACQNLPRFAYFPFGGGPRQCIGAAFATTEAMLILATIAQKYRLVSAETAPISPVPSMTLRPKGPIPMRVTARC